MSTSLLEAAFAHHVWATSRLIDACLDISVEDLRERVEVAPVPGIEVGLDDLGRAPGHGPIIPAQSSGTSAPSGLKGTRLTSAQPAVAALAAATTSGWVYAWNRLGELRSGFPVQPLSQYNTLPVPTPNPGGKTRLPARGHRSAPAPGDPPGDGTPHTPISPQHRPRSPRTGCRAA